MFTTTSQLKGILDQAPRLVGWQRMTGFAANTHAKLLEDLHVLSAPPLEFHSRSIKLRALMFQPGRAHKREHSCQQKSYPSCRSSRDRGGVQRKLKPSRRRARPSFGRDHRLFFRAQTLRAAWPAGRSWTSLPQRPGCARSVSRNSQARADLRVLGRYARVGPRW